MAVAEGAIVKAVGIAVVLFFVALGVVVGLRMDDRTVSMLGGVAIGLIIGVPCALLGMQAAQGRYGTPVQHYAEPPPMPDALPTPTTYVTNNILNVFVMPQRSAPNSTGRTLAQKQIEDAHN